jgi:hypothetical protein
MKTLLLSLSVAATMVAAYTGGSGGDGGPGGKGGGGRGGHSIGIAYRGTAPPTESITIQTGIFGAGGQGADAAGNGKEGVKANTLAF